MSPFTIVFGYVRAQKKNESIVTILLGKNSLSFQ